MAHRLVHTGQAVVDLVMEVDRLPERGGDVLATAHHQAAGGGFNVMAAAARDGADVVYAGGHGRGPFGDLVRTALAEEGVRVASPPDAHHDTGFSVALIDADAERTFVSTLGAEGRLDADHLAAAQVRSGDVVYVSGYSLVHPGPGGALREWLPTVADRATIVVDPSPMVAEIPRAVLATARTVTDVWTANEREAGLLLQRLRAGSEPVQEPRDLASALREALAATVIVRVGRAGCWLAEHAAGPAQHLPGTPAAAVDTNGAGDAHAGVLCAGLATGRSLQEAARRANVAAAIAVTRRGPATSPTGEEIDQAVGRMA